MAVLNILEQPRDRDGLLNAAVNDQSVNRTWLIQVSGREENSLTIQQSGLWQVTMPKFLEPHPDNSFFRARGVRLEYLGPNLWKATADYTTGQISIEEIEKQQFPNPLDRFAKYSVDAGTTQEYVSKDAYDTPYNNSAGEPYPAQPENKGYSIIKVRKNVTDFSTEWFNLTDTVNASQVTIYDGYKAIVIPAEYGLLQPVKISELQQEDNYRYYTASTEIHVARADADPGKWRTKIQDQGFYWKDAFGRKLVRFVVHSIDPATGEAFDPPVYEPSPTEQLLGGDGYPLFALDGTLWNPSVTGPQFNEFRPKKAVSWSGLPFFS